MLYDKFENQYIVKGKLYAVDPIHIGSSAKNSLDPTEVDDSVLKDPRGLPVIPGSSLKGVVRSYFESVLRGAGIDVCYVLDEKNCCTEKNKGTFGKINDPHKKAEAAYECSCEACRLFGGREFAGKIQFKDCYAEGKPSLEHRDGVAIDRKTGAAKGKAKYDFEIVSKDSEFSFYMVANNLDEKQKKYLDFIIDAMKSGELSVGGKTSRGLGRFKLVDIEIEELTAASVKEKLGL